MIPVECVVRNIAAGSICKRLGLKEGLELNPPTFEFFYKDDDLHDPMINDFHIISFKWATENEITQMKEKTLKEKDQLEKAKTEINPIQFRRARHVIKENEGYLIVPNLYD